MLVAKDPYEEVLKEMHSIHEAKNADYGMSAARTFETFGMIAYLVRLSDKLNRAVHLVQSGQQSVKEESLYDTLLDMSNYAAMAAAELRLRKNENKKEKGNN